jgi:hypothetical protein
MLKARARAILARALIESVLTVGVVTARKSRLAEGRQ